MSPTNLYRNRVGGGTAWYDDAFAAANAAVLELVVPEEPATPAPAESTPVPTQAKAATQRKAA